MDTFHNIYFILLVLGLFIGLMRMKSLNNSSKWMLLLLFLTILCEGLSILFKQMKINNSIIFHIFSPIEFFLIAWAFKGELKSKLIFLFILFYLVFSLINSVYVQYYKTQFISNAFDLESFLIIFLILWYLKRLLEQNVAHSFTEYPMFWISVGFLFFSVINLFILGTHNVLANIYPEINHIFRPIRFVSNYLLYAMFIVAFLSSQKQLSDSK